MKRNRLLILAVLAMALPLSLSVPGKGYTSVYRGEVDNLDDQGICYWKCYYPPGRAHSAPASSGGACVQLCNASCSGPCAVLY